MSEGIRTSTRKRKMRVETPSKQTETSKKWSETEVEKYLKCIMKNGHKNLKKLEECFPERNLQVIKSFLRTAYDTAIRLENGHPNLDAWLVHCKGVGQNPPWKDSIQIAQVVKYLSVDGLIENHPLPSQSQKIDFSNAYRLIYQALMGYPIQPVNEETSNFVIETLKELAVEIKKEIIPTKNVSEFLKEMTSDTAKPKEMTSDALKTNGMTSVKNSQIQKNESVVFGNNDFKKPLKVYERKRPKLSNDSQVPTLKIVVEANNTCSNSPGTQDFSVTIDSFVPGSKSTVLQVPVPVRMESVANINKNEEELLKSMSYNPFQIPEKWLKEPFYLNLLIKNVKQ